MLSTQDDRMQVAEAMFEFGQTSPMEASTKYETNDDGNDIWNNPDFVNSILALVEMTEHWVNSINALMLPIIVTTVSHLSLL
jgi:hypothetical protein